MKIIFLDIDGVLNSQRSAVANSDFGNIMDHDSWNALDPVAIKLLRHVCNETGADCILSSSWRILATQEDIIAFQDFLEVPIIGVTPRGMHGVRGEEIKEWLDNCKEHVESFCIVDDDNDMLDDQQDNFVQTDERIGLTWQNCKDMISIINGCVEYN